MKIVEVVVLGVMFAIASIICDPPQDFSHFGDDTRTTHSYGKTKDAGVITERPCLDFAH